MVKILNFGSLNIDHVYTVEHFVRPGETIAAESYQRFPGGKGLNQSIALSHAGAQVWHAGRIGEDGLWLRERLRREGVDTTLIQVAGDPTGHAMIQVGPGGENAIIIFGGANQCIARDEITNALLGFGYGDYLLLQNEVSCIADMIRIAKERGMTVVFNPAPMTPQVATYPLELVDIFILNEIEAQELTGKTDPTRIGAVMGEKYPQGVTVLTLGAKGAICFDSGNRYDQAAESVQAVDTTAAGDTFIGFFLAGIIQSRDAQKALASGCHAAALCVSHMGAADSIPRKEEL